MGTPAVWLGAAVAICIGLFAAGVVGMFNAAQRAKHEAGLAKGRGESSVATLEAAREAADIDRRAEAETPLVTIPAELIAICKRSASCLERYELR
jgi:hypothetical protein